MSALKTRIASLSLPVHFILAVLSFGIFRATNIVLDGFYARSQFPVSYFVGQTAFDGAQIKEWYAVMQTAGTFNIYVQTQLFDYLFMLTMATMGLMVPLLVRRAYHAESLAFRVTTLASTLIPLGAMMDAMENLVSFVMLAMPQTFPNWIALVYSSFASIKFGLVGVGYICVFAGILIGLVTMVMRLFTTTPRQSQPQH